MQDNQIIQHLKLEYQALQSHQLLHHPQTMMGQRLTQHPQFLIIEQFTLSDFVARSFYFQVFSHFLHGEMISSIPQLLFMKKVLSSKGQQLPASVTKTSSNKIILSKNKFRFLKKNLFKKYSLYKKQLLFKNLFKKHSFVKNKNQFL